MRSTVQRLERSLLAILLGVLTLASVASAANDRENRGDPKTTYDQKENETHSGKNGGSSEVNATTSSAVTTSSQSSPEGHWLVRQVKQSSGGQWTLYENGQVKQVEGL